MKVTRKRPPSKDWQKVDARVLGQILAAQNIDFVLPDIDRVAEFFAETLIAIPGIKSCRACLEDVTVQKGGKKIRACLECQVLRKNAAEQREVPGEVLDFQCRLANRPKIEISTVDSLRRRFGFFVFQIDDLDTFNLYKPFINNLANYVALSLENRLQHDMLQESRNELESKVEERTQDLATSEQKLRGVFDAMEEALTLNELVYDENGEIVDYLILEANPAFESVTGLTHDQVIGKKATELYPMTPEYINSFWKEHLHDEHAIKTDMYVEQLNRWEHVSTSIPVKGKFVVSFFDITELKNVENALREGEEKYRTLVEEASEGIFLADPQGCYVDVNPAGCSMLGYTREEILNLNMEDLVSAGEQINEPIRFDELRSGKIILSERTLISKSGAPLPVEINGKVLENGYFLGLVRDITERKEAEQERLAHLHFIENMDQVNRAIHGTNDLSQMMSDVLDAVLAIFDCDRAWLNYPCDPETPVLQVPMERTKPEYPGASALGIELTMSPALADSIRTVLDTNGPVGFGQGNEYPLQSDISAHNSIQSMLVMALYPKVGKPWMFGIHQCSHPRAWNPEEERTLQEIGRRLNDALSSLLMYRNLQESEERYRQLVELSPDSISTFDEGGTIRFVNSAAVQIAGAKSVDDLVGRPFMDFVYPDSREDVKKQLDQMLATGESISFVEERFIRPDGSPLDVEAAAVPFKHHGKQYVQIIARDITDRKHHELEREAIITVSNALRRATTRKEVIALLLDQFISLFDADGAMLAVPHPKDGGALLKWGVETLVKDSLVCTFLLVAGSVIG